MDLHETHIAAYSVRTSAITSKNVRAANHANVRETPHPASPAKYSP
jgi:hypothetical protein